MAPLHEQQQQVSNAKASSMAEELRDDARMVGTISNKWVPHGSHAVATLEAAEGMVVEVVSEGADRPNNGGYPGFPRRAMLAKAALEEWVDLSAGARDREIMSDETARRLGFEGNEKMIGTLETRKAALAYASHGFSEAMSEAARALNPEGLSRGALEATLCARGVDHRHLLNQRKFPFRGPVKVVEPGKKLELRTMVGKTYYYDEFIQTICELLQRPNLTYVLTGTTMKMLSSHRPLPPKRETLLKDVALEPIFAPEGIVVMRRPDEFEFDPDTAEACAGGFQIFRLFLDSTNTVSALVRVPSLDGQTTGGDPFEDDVLPERLAASLVASVAQKNVRLRESPALQGVLFRAMVRSKTAFRPPSGKIEPANQLVAAVRRLLLVIPIEDGALFEPSTTLWIVWLMLACQCGYRPTQAEAEKVDRLLEATVSCPTCAWHPHVFGEPVPLAERDAKQCALELLRDTDPGTAIVRHDRHGADSVVYALRVLDCFPAMRTDRKMIWGVIGMIRSGTYRFSDHHHHQAAEDPPEQHRLQKLSPEQRVRSVLAMAPESWRRGIDFHCVPSVATWVGLFGDVLAALVREKTGPYFERTTSLVWQFSSKRNVRLSDKDNAAVFPKGAKRADLPSLDGRSRKLECLMDLLLAQKFAKYLAGPPPRKEEEEHEDAAMRDTATVTFEPGVFRHGSASSVEEAALLTLWEAGHAFDFDGRPHRAFLIAGSLVVIDGANGDATVMHASRDALERVGIAGLENFFGPRRQQCPDQPQQQRSAEIESPPGREVLPDDPTVARKLAFRALWAIGNGQNTTAPALFQPSWYDVDNDKPWGTVSATISTYLCDEWKRHLERGDTGTLTLPSLHVSVRYSALEGGGTSLSARTVWEENLETAKIVARPAEDGRRRASTSLTFCCLVGPPPAARDSLFDWLTKDTAVETTTPSEPPSFSRPSRDELFVSAAVAASRDPVRALSERLFERLRRLTRLVHGDWIGPAVLLRAKLSSVRRRRILFSKYNRNNNSSPFGQDDSATGIATAPEHTNDLGAMLLLVALTEEFNFARMASANDPTEWEVEVDGTPLRFARSVVEDLRVRLQGASPEWLVGLKPDARWTDVTRVLDRVKAQRDPFPHQLETLAMAVRLRFGLMDSTSMGGGKTFVAIVLAACMAFVAERRASGGGGLADGASSVGNQTTQNLGPRLAPVFEQAKKRAKGGPPASGARSVLDVPDAPPPCVLAFTCSNVTDTWSSEAKLLSDFVEVRVFNAKSTPNDFVRFVRETAAAAGGRVPLAVVEYDHYRMMTGKRGSVPVVWSLVVYDEGHLLRDPTTKRHEACVTGVYAHAKHMMTGTPVNNRAEEIFQLLSVLEVPHYGDASYACKRNKHPDQWRAALVTCLSTSSALLREDCTDVNPPVRADFLNDGIRQAYDAKIAEAFKRNEIKQGWAGLMGFVSKFSDKPDRFRSRMDEVLLASDEKRQPPEGCKVRRAVFWSRTERREASLRGVSSDDVRAAIEDGTLLLSKAAMEEWAAKNKSNAQVSAAYAESDVRRLSLLWHQKDGHKLPVAKQLLAGSLRLTDAAPEVSANAKAIVFCNTKEEVRLALNALPEGSSIELASAADVDAFERCSRLRVGVGLYARIGTGLNMQFVELVVFFSLNYNPAVISQALCRANRTGQTRRVKVMYCWTAGSVEERVAQILTEKTRHAAEMTAGTAIELLKFDADEAAAKAPLAATGSLNQN